MKFLRGEGSDWLRTEERSERRQPPQEEVEVEVGGGEDGVDAVAVLALEVVAVHSMVGLEVADHRLDGGAALPLVFYGGGGPPDVAADTGAEAVGVVVAAIALVDVDAPDLDAGVLFEVGDGGFQRVGVERIAMQRLGVEDELAAFGSSDRDSDRHLAAEFVRGSGLALADALDLRGVQRIDLRPAPPLAREADFDRQCAQRREAFGELLIPGEAAHQNEMMPPPVTG